MSQQQIKDDLIDKAILQTILEIIQRGEEGEVGGGRTNRQSRRLANTAGQDYLDQLLSSGNEDRIKAVFRMSKTTFILLQNWLVEHTQLTALMHISVELKLAIFLYITTRPT